MRRDRQRLVAACAPIAHLHAAGIGADRRCGTQLISGDGRSSKTGRPDTRPNCHRESCATCGCQMFLAADAFPDFVNSLPNAGPWQEAGAERDRRVPADSRHPAKAIPDGGRSRFPGWQASTRLRRVQGNRPLNAVVMVTAAPESGRALEEVPRTHVKRARAMEV